VRWTRFLPVLVPVVAVLVAAAIGLVLVAVTSESVGEAIEAFLDGAAGSAYAIGASLNRAVALALVGLGFIIANRANLTNVGGEGQIAVGGIMATALALQPAVAGLPFCLAFLLPLLAAMLCGAVWGAIAGVLKVRFGANEVITTLLLTFVGIWLVYWSVESVYLLRQPMTSSATLPQSAEIATTTRLPLLFDDPSIPLHIGLPLTVVAAILVGIVLRHSAFAVRLMAVGMNETAARRAGLPCGLITVGALAIAGAFGGAAGGIMMLGEQYVLKSGFSSGYGFDGLVVGLLSRGSATGVAVGAVFFGFLRSGGINMEISAGVPSAVVLIMQGLIVVSVAGAGLLLERSGREP
jgi:simple sugar transport system permease protein